MPEFMKTSEVARYLRVSEIKLAQDRSRGHGPPFVKMGRSIRYDRDAVDRWVADHTVTPTPAQRYTMTPLQVVKAAESAPPTDRAVPPSDS